MKTHPLVKTPRGLKGPEKRLFSRVISDLQARGIDPALVPFELIKDYVAANSRIEKLEEMAQNVTDPKLKLGAYRQLEAAVTQRRQLATALYAPVGKKRAAAMSASNAAAGTSWEELLQPRHEQ